MSTPIRNVIGGAASQDVSPGGASGLGLGSLSRAPSESRLTQEEEADNFEKLRASLAGEGGTEEVLSSRTLQWEQQATAVDQKQTEFFHLQWQLFREQISTFSRELVMMRKNMQTLQKLSEGETQQRVEGMARLSAQVAELNVHTQTVAGGLQREETTREDEKKQLESKFSDMEQRVMRRLEELHLEDVRLKDALDIERKERIDGDNFSRTQASKLTSTIEEERGERLSVCDKLAADMQSLRAAQDRDHKERLERNVKIDAELKELRANLEKQCADNRTSIDEGVRRLEDGLAQETRALGDETRARAKLDEDLREALRRVQDEISREKHDRAEAGKQLESSLNSVRGMLEEEGNQRKAVSDESARLAQTSRLDLEKEILERKGGADDLARLLTELKGALDSERSERSREAKSLEQEVHKAVAEQQRKAKEFEVNLQQTDDYLDAECSARSKMFLSITAQMRAITEQLDAAAHRAGRVNHTSIQESVVITRTAR